MAGGKERVLRRRIKSVQSTKKITKAMELIAASRIVKAQNRVAAARPYSERITEVIRNLATAGASFDHPLLRKREQIRKIGYVIVTADRGLAGAYNSSVIRVAERAMRSEQARSRDYGLVLAGRKAQGYFRFRNYRIDAALNGFSEQPRYSDAKSVAAEVIERFESGEYDRVQLVYTEFLSAASQRVRMRQLLPLDTGAMTQAPDGPTAAYEFEPSPTGILASLLPRYVESRIYTAMLDAAASEHAARQRAMKSATDNAQDLITNLTRIMNRARQDSITTEIMEIVGGAEALRQAASDGEDLLIDHVGGTADIFRARVGEHITADQTNRSTAR